jgi:hypothetical protein
MKGVIIGAVGVKSPVAPDILIFLDLVMSEYSN